MRNRQRDRERQCRIGRNTDRERQRKRDREGLVLFCFGFLTSSSITMLYRGQVPRLTSDNFTCSHTRDSVGRP